MNAINAGNADNSNNAKYAAGILRYGLLPIACCLKYKV